ncbi:MAG: ion transporter [Shimia sp.]|nr:ion transporter [Shimia sp.]
MVGLSNDHETLFGNVTAVFFFFFLAEFCIRFFLKGREYMKPWGWIDLAIVVIDGLSTAVFFGLVDLSGAAGIGGLLRVFRILRLFRAAKLLRFATETRHIKRLYMLSKPYVTAFFGCAVLAVVAVFGLLFFAFVFAGANPVEQFKDLFEEVMSSLRKEDDTSGATTVATIFVLAAVANMIAIFFMPIMNRIAEQQRQMSDTDLIEAHVIFCVNNIKNYEGSLEEFVHVFSNNADRDIYVLIEEDAEIDTDELSELGRNVQVLRGDMTAPRLWRQALVQRASAIFLFGRHDTLSVDDVLLLAHDSQNQRPDRLVVFDIDEDQGTPYERRSHPNDNDVDIVSLDIFSLRERIEANAWNRRSLQYAFLHALADDYEDQIEFPELTYVDGDADAAQRLKQHLEASGNLQVEQRTHNLLVGSREHKETETDEEIDEIRMLEEIRQVIAAHPEDAQKSAVFVYIETLELVEWNARFTGMNAANVSVIAVEIALAFALFHEMDYPGILTGWFCDLDEENTVGAPSKLGAARFELRSNPPRSGTPERIGSRQGLEDGWIILGQTADPTPVVVSKPTDRLDLKNGGQLLIGRMF